MASPYRINLPVYEGPLDLLLDLIRKQEMDIHNIPIAKITEQYLDYLHQLEKLDIDVSADFIYMAATLIHIKSKMLLPPDPLAGPEEQEDPRDELVHRLLEHEKFKNAAQLLYQKQQIEDHVWSHPDRTLYAGEEVEGELVVSLVDLVKVFSAGPRAPQGSDEIRAAARKCHHRADDGPPAPAPDLHGRSGLADRILRSLRDAQCHDRGAAGGAGNGAHAGRAAGAVGAFRGYSPAQAQNVRRRVLPAPMRWRKSRSNICDPA